MATLFAISFLLGVFCFIFGIILFYIGLVKQNAKRDRNVLIIVASAFFTLFSYGGLSIYHEVTSFDSITAQISLSLRNEARKNESFVDAAASMEQPQGEQTAGNNESSSAQQEEPANNEQHTPQLSREERNALNRAERYLSSNAFSQSSLKRQLLYEDFSESAADFAVATVNADWNEQALKKALRYSQNLSLSDERVANQLSYEGFTSEQIEYALTRLPD
ncbi:Ltp family lipoprotein [Enterococcus innesii]|nr:Ltp family lipoprotein [Enterococcus innesii]